MVKKKKANIMDFTGSISKETANKLEKEISELRELSRKRDEKIDKLLKNI